MKKKLDSILLIDDDTTVNFLHAFIIESENICETLQIAETADQALVLLSSTSPDLILLDLNMPKTTGWEFLVKYKSNVNEKNRACIFILSSSANPDDRIKAENSPDVFGFYNKPLTKEIIKEIVGITLKRQQPNKKN